MPIRVDPEGNEINSLLEIVELDGKQVLEIGCGDGRLTWRYALKAADVTAVDPSVKSIAKAKQNTPKELKGRVQFHPVGFDDFAAATAAGSFDVAILSWSL